MEIVILKMLFALTVSAQYGKVIYVEESHTWHDAQRYCRVNHTDLSPIIPSGYEVILKNASRLIGKFWIGLYRDGTQWKWSGGGVAADIPWDSGQPDSDGFGAICWHSCEWNGWRALSSSRELPFFCLNLILVETKKTWEQARSHCKRNYKALTSLNDETEHLLALGMIKHNHITQRVWIGLRYLGDHWLWVNNYRLNYREPWRDYRDDQCPISERCGALTKEGQWETWDCQDKLHFICH